MPRYRVNLFLQHDDTPYGCHFTIKTDARTPDHAIGKAKVEASELCFKYHPDIELATPHLTGQVIEMKPLKEQKP